MKSRREDTTDLSSSEATAILILLPAVAGFACLTVSTLTIRLVPEIATQCTYLRGERELSCLFATSNRFDRISRGELHHDHKASFFE